VQEERYKFTTRVSQAGGKEVSLQRENNNKREIKREMGGGDTGVP